MEIKCIITDDEPIARKGLKGYIEQIDFLTLAGECSNAIELNSLLKKQEADLLFLNIEMPYLSGIDFLNGLPNPPKVILTTAYAKYALKGYELDVIDYLLKPISFERFLKAVNKVYNLYGKENEEEDNFFFVKSDKQYKKILFDDILLIESMENYIIIHTPHAKEIVHSTLKNVMESLPADKFLQVHRCYIINTGHVQSIEGNQLIIGTHKIPIAKGQREEVFRLLLKKLL